MKLKNILFESSGAPGAIKVSYQAVNNENVVIGVRTENTTSEQCKTYSKAFKWPNWMLSGTTTEQVLKVRNFGDNAQSLKGNTVNIYCSYPNNIKYAYGNSAEWYMHIDSTGHEKLLPDKFRPERVEKWNRQVNDFHKIELKNENDESIDESYYQDILPNGVTYTCKFGIETQIDGSVVTVYNVLKSVKSSTGKTYTPNKKKYLAEFQTAAPKDDGNNYCVSVISAKTGTLNLTEYFWMGMEFLTQEVLQQKRDEFLSRRPNMAALANSFTIDQNYYDLEDYDPVKFGANALKQITSDMLPPKEEEPSGVAQGVHDMMTSYGKYQTIGTSYKSGKYGSYQPKGGGY